MCSAERVSSRYPSARISHEAIGALDADARNRLIVIFVETVGQPQDSGKRIDRRPRRCRQAAVARLRPRQRPAMIAADQPHDA